MGWTCIPILNILTILQQNTFPKYYIYKLLLNESKNLVWKMELQKSQNHREYPPIPYIHHNTPYFKEMIIAIRLKFAHRKNTVINSPKFLDSSERGNLLLLTSPFFFFSISQHILQIYLLSNILAMFIPESPRII